MSGNFGRQNVGSRKLPLKANRRASSMNDRQAECSLRQKCTARRLLAGRIGGEAGGPTVLNNAGATNATESARLA